MNCARGGLVVLLATLPACIGRILDTPVRDAGPADARTDAGVVDAPADRGFDTVLDAPSDTGNDNASDALAETGTDAASDTRTDALAETGTDAASDARTDIVSDRPTTDTPRVDGGCGGGLVACGGVCVDVTSNNANCGACGMACASGQSCVSGTCTIVDVGLVVDDAASVREGETLVYAGRINAASVARTFHITITRRMAVGTATADQNSMRANLFTPGEYIANGTVFTRGVASMPLAANSAAIATYAPTMPATYLPAAFSGWLVTSINTEHYNIPIYVVDSTNPAQTYSTFQSTDARVTTQPDLVRLTTGRIPLPTYGVPDSIGDRAMAIYDKGNGLMREYFYAVRQSDGSWQFAASGIYQSNRWFENLSTVTTSCV